MAIKRVCRQWVFTLVMATWLGAASATAQPPPQDDPNASPADQRSTEFRAMEGPSKESVPGGALLVTAYAAVWLVLFGLVWRIASRQKRVEADLARLEKLLRPE